MNNLFGLRDYQWDAVTQIENAWRSGIKAICYQCPTGSGKTKVLRSIINNHAASKKIIYVIAHRKNLVSQLSQELVDAGIRHGIIAAGYPYINYRVQVCSLQTLIKRIDRLTPAELIIVDEFHHAKSKSYMNIIKTWEDSYILGVTATPRRLDGKPLSDIAQKLIVGPTMKQLISQGYLSKYEYYAPDIISTQGLHKQAGDYIVSEYIDKVNNNVIIGSAVEHYRKYADHQPAIVSCASIAHAEHVASEFKEAGYKALAIHSGLDQDNITAGINGLKDGSIELLMQCELLGEGIDIPGAVVLIGLRPTASETIFLQHIGRVLRPCQGKETAIILDHVGNWERHGLPIDERNWSLDGSMKIDKGVLDYKRCPECINVVKKHVRECPYCGHIWESADIEPRIPEQKEGELRLINEEDHTIKITVDWQTLIEIITNEARSLKQAVDLAVRYGKTNRHAYYIWTNIMGRKVG
jgi:DNA repair protein RadD